MALVASSSLPSPADPTQDVCTALADFQKVLTAEQRRMLDLHTQTAKLKKPDTSTVIQFVAELDATNHAKLKKSVAPRLCTILDAVSQFTGVVDTFVSSNPAIAALVWGSIKTAILVASSFAQYFDKVTRLIMQIGQTCPIYREFAELYSDSVDLQNALCQYYAVMLRLFAKIVTVSQRTVVTRLTSSITSSFDTDFQEFQRQMTESSKIVTLRISLAAQRTAQESYEISKREFKESEAHRKLFQKFRSEWRTEQEAARQLQTLREGQKLRASIKDRLSSIDYLKAWKRIQASRLQGTAEWFAHDPAYQNWTNDPDAGVLWCSGKMGVGKSVLIANVVSLLCQSLPSKRIISHHFCSAENIATTSAAVIMGTIARQLLTPQLQTMDNQSLRYLHDRCADLEAEEIAQFMIAHLIEARDYYIVLDGLDECTSEQITLLMQSITKFRTATQHTFHILLCGRPELEHTVQREMSPKYRLTFSHDIMQNDVERYINATLHDCLSEEKIRLIHPETILSVADTLHEVYNDFFLFARLFIEEICTLKCEADIIAALKHPPRKVADLIAQKMCRVRTGAYGSQAIQLLRYCGVLRRPLTIHEAGELLSIIEPQQSLDRARIPQNMDQIISSCCGLLYLDEEYETIHYVHRSVVRHLFCPHGTDLVDPEQFDASEVGLALGRLCLTYLNFNDFKRQLTKTGKLSKLNISPLDIGLSSVQTSNTIVSRAAQRLLQSRRQIKRTSGIDISSKVEEILGHGEYSRLRAFETSVPFHFLEYTCEHWIYHVSDLTHEQGPKLWSLFESLVEGQNELAKRPWLLAKQCLATYDISWDPHLSWAMEIRHHAMLRYLVKKALNDPSSPRLANALRYAVRYSQKAIITALAHVVNCENDAFYHATVEAVEILLVDGIIVFISFLIGSVSSIQKEYPMLLEKAVQQQRYNLVCLLCRRGIDVNARLEISALRQACSLGDKAIIHQLLDAGANIHASKSPFREPLLIEACLYGFEKFLRLELGADIGVATYHKHCENLSYLSRRDEVKDAIQLLLNAGVDVNARSQYGKAALHIACELGEDSIVQTLLDAGADVNAYGPGSNTALQIACANGNTEIVQVLLAAGANANAYGPGSNIALQSACADSDGEIVQMLLDAGADVNAHGLENRTALQIACAKSNRKIIQTLLAAGAGVNVYGPENTTALEIACMNGNTEIVQMLLDAGTDVHTQGYIHQSALEQARSRGHTEIVQLLSSASISPAKSSEGRYGAIHDARAW